MHETRESWLNAAEQYLREEFFEGKGLSDKVRLSVGFPFGSKKARAQVWSCEHSEDGTYEIFVSPSYADPIEVISDILHEMGHILLGHNEGHGPKFAKLMKEFGFSGKPSATYAEEGSELEYRLKHIAEKLGAYPHAALHPTTRPRKTAKTNRWVRLKSMVNPDYKIVISPNMIKMFGMPKDPWGAEMEYNNLEDALK